MLAKMQAAMTPLPPDSVITCICTPDLATEQGALASLKATTAEFPDAIKFAAADVMSPAIETYCKEAGWRVVLPDSPKPPRMKELLKKCLDQINTEYVWTIEHDCTIRPGARNGVEALLRKYPAVAGIECMSYNSVGEVTAPCSSKELIPYPPEPRLLSVAPYGSLNCVCWRTETLRALNWEKIREYPYTDRDVSAQCRAAGKAICVAPEYHCVHRMSGARFALRVKDKLAENPTAPPVLLAALGRPLRIAAILPVRDEGGRSLTTVRAIRKAKRSETILRFVVVDDGSVDHGADVFPGAKDIAYVKNPTARGEGFSRNLGLKMARVFNPDFMIVFDAHVEIDFEGLERLAEAALETGALVCATTWQLNPHERDFPRNGAHLVWIDKRPTDPKGRMGLLCSWSYTRKEKLQPVKALLGASYGATPATWDALDGFGDGPFWDTAGNYGFGEQNLAIKAFFLDIPQFSHTQVNVKHFFRVQRPYGVPSEHYWYNFVRCTKILFSDEVFRSKFLACAEIALPANRRIQEIASDAALIPLRDKFAARKKHTDAECLEWLGIK